MTYKYHIAIGISAGIAGYKIVDLIKTLKRENIRISVVMTDSAVKMFGSDMFKNAGGRIYQQLLPASFDYRAVLKDKKVEHISLSDSLDLLLLAPATANMIAKIAMGLADDYLTTLVLSVTCPVLIAPSMNSNMWHNAATMDNLRKLKNLGYFIIPPDKGQLACGYQGVGRLKNISDIKQEILDFLNSSKRLKGLKILVTAGGTSVPIDSVRVITNKASGKFGKYIAEACFRSGADVLLLRSENSVISNLPIQEKIFQSNQDLQRMLEQYCKSYDIIFHSASIADFYPERSFRGKMKSESKYTIILKREEKLIGKIKKLNPKIILVGFKAEVDLDEHEIRNIGQTEIKKYGADYVIINDVGRDGIGFGSDDNEIYIVGNNGLYKKFAKQKKQILARKLIETIFPI